MTRWGRIPTELTASGCARHSPSASAPPPRAARSCADSAQRRAGRRGEDCSRPDHRADDAGSADLSAAMRLPATAGSSKNASPTRAVRPWLYRSVHSASARRQRALPGHLPRVDVCRSCLAGCRHARQPSRTGSTCRVRTEGARACAKRRSIGEPPGSPRQPTPATRLTNCARSAAVTLTESDATFSRAGRARGLMSAMYAGSSRSPTRSTATSPRSSCLLHDRHGRPGRMTCDRQVALRIPSSGNGSMWMPPSITGIRSA